MKGDLISPVPQLCCDGEKKVQLDNEESPVKLLKFSLKVEKLISLFT